MTKKFRKGQLVVHPQQGVFKLQKIEKRKIAEYEELYLILTPFFKIQGGLKIFIPLKIGESVGIRRVGSKRDILKSLRAAARFLEKNPVKDVEGSDEIIEVWAREADFKSSLIFLGQLYFKSKISKDIKMAERKFYKRLLEMLSEELAVAKRCSKKFSQKQLLDKFEKVFNKKEFIEK